MNTETTDRCERNVLAAVLRWPESFAEVAVVVSTQDFRVSAHQLCFQGLCELYEHNKPLDLEFLSSWLSDRGKVDEIGGYGFLGDLIATQATGAHAEHFAQQVRAGSILRRLGYAGQEIQTLAQKPSGSAEETLALAERIILDIAELGHDGKAVSLADAVMESAERYDARASRAQEDLCGIPSGFIDLDLLTSGFQNGELTIIACRPSVGKTAFGCNVARHVACDLNKPVFLVSLEMNRVEIADRLICAQARIDSHHMRGGRLTAEELAAAAKERGTLMRAPLRIDDSPTQTMLRINANARRMQRRHGIKLVIVDYLQLIEPASRRDSRQEQVAGISRRLKLMARELNLPVLVMAQLNRDADDHALPRLSDLRESGAIEQDADNVLLLHRLKDKPEELHVLVSKQRNGPTGRVPLVWVKRYMRFENWVKVETVFD